MTSHRICLVIEDDEDIRELIAFILAQEGFEVYAEETGAGGVAAAQRLGPALITLDLGLPDMDGLEVARQLRIRSTAPVLMITAFAGTGYELDAIAAGVGSYLSKPFRPSQLREIVHRLCPPEQPGDAAELPRAHQPARTRRQDRTV